MCVIQATVLVAAIQPITTYRLKYLGRDMLEKATDELAGWQLDGPMQRALAMFARRLTIAELDRLP